MELTRCGNWSNYAGETSKLVRTEHGSLNVSVRPVPNSESNLCLFVDAMLVVGQFNEPVYFPVVLNNKNGAAEIHDSE